MSASINLEDPAVRRLLEGNGAQQTVVMPGSTRKAAMTQIAGDEDRGFTSTQYLNRGKQEVACLVRPKNSVTMVAGVSTVDVYAIPGEPVKLHIICPRCLHQLTIDGGKKPIDWRPADTNPHAAEVRAHLPPEDQWVAGNLGIISVGQFQCTWELEDQMQDKGKDVHVIAKGSLCRFTGVIERNVLKEV
jgi:hypothetical protein